MLVKGSVAGDAFLSGLLEYDQFVAYTPYQQGQVERHPILDDEDSQGVALVAVEHSAWPASISSSTKMISRSLRAA